MKRFLYITIAVLGLVSCSKDLTEFYDRADQIEAANNAQTQTNKELEAANAALKQEALRLQARLDSLANAYKDLPYYSIQTDTDYANIMDRHTLTFGLGYRGSSFYADLAYKYDTYKSNLYPFVVNKNNTIYPNTPTRVSNNRHQVMLTLGVRF